MTKKEFEEIIEAACKHPNLYTPGGSFYEIASFLEGYGIGANPGQDLPFRNDTVFEVACRKVSGW